MTDTSLSTAQLTCTLLLVAMQSLASVCTMCVGVGNSAIYSEL
jgi:hypothetical protein